MSVDVVGFDDDFDLRRVEAFGPVSFEPIGVRTAAPAGLSAVSTIKPVETEESLPPLRPKLVPPMKGYMLDIIELQNEFEEITSQYIDMASETIHTQIDQLQAISKERADALQKHAAEVATQQTWGVWATVAQYITTTASVILGISLISTGVGATAGYFLVASGGLGLVNRVANDLGAWNYLASCFADSFEDQQKIARWIDLGIFITSLSLGVAGGVIAYKVGAFALAAAASGQEISGKVTQIVGLAGSILGMGARVGESLAARKSLNLQADIQLIDARSFNTRRDLDESSLDTKKTIETAASIAEEVRRAVLSSEIHLD
jgi:hypothetical protein